MASQERVARLTSTRASLAPQVHRVAARHRRELLNRAFKATSPNGRFTEGARQINQQPLRRVEAHGCVPSPSWPSAAC